MARAATGQDPHGKYPTNRPLLIYIISYDLDTLGRVIHRLLFREGAFRLIKDKVTGKWRSWRPWEEEDAAREDETEATAPLISKQFIEGGEKGFAWDSKKENSFSLVRLNFGEGHPMNGTEIRAYGSKSEPAMGDPVDLIWIDEDLYNESWATEMEMRLLDRKGRMFWTAFPLSKNNAMYNISLRAEKQKDLENPDVEQFIISTRKNLFIDSKELQKKMDGMSAEEVAARIDGEYELSATLMYPQFSREVHGLPRTGNPEEEDLLEKLCPNGVIPANWTRYLSIDPGHSVCAVIFAAMPPPKEAGDYVIIYDELYLKQCSAEIFAREVKRKITRADGGFDIFQTFIIDDHGSRVTQAGSGTSIRYQYSEALRAKEIRSIMTDYGFVKGSDNVEGRAEIVRSWLNSRPETGPKLRIVLAKCPNLVTEFNLYKKRVLFGSNATDKPIPIHNHACNALEYLAAFNPYHQPPPASRVHSPVYDLYMKLFGNKNANQAIELGPAATPNGR